MGAVSPKLTTKKVDTTIATPPANEQSKKCSFHRPPSLAESNIALPNTPRGPSAVFVWKFVQGWPQKAAWTHHGETIGMCVVERGFVMIHTKPNRQWDKQIVVSSLVCGMANGTEPDSLPNGIWGRSHKTRGSFESSERLFVCGAHGFRQTDIQVYTNDNLFSVCASRNTGSFFVDFPV